MMGHKTARKFVLNPVAVADGPNDDAGEQGRDGRRDKGLTANFASHRDANLALNSQPRQKI